MESFSVIEKTQDKVGIFFAKVYSWMSLALLVTSAVAMWIYFFGGEILFRMPAVFSIAFVVIVIFQLILVFSISFLINRLSTELVVFLFLLYSLLNGVIIGFLASMYSLASLSITFFATMLTFGVMAVIGIRTKRDLSGLGAMAFFGLIGLIIASIINLVLFAINPTFADSFSWLLTYVGIGIFLILIAWDNQRIKKVALFTDGSNKLALREALSLYLNFINLFIRLLRIFGQRR